MTLFEYAVCVSLGVIAFVKLYDWIEFQIASREEVAKDEQP
jgi:hypothetical protein